MKRQYLGYAIISRSKRSGNPRKWVCGRDGTYGQDGCSYMHYLWPNLRKAKAAAKRLATFWPTRTLHVVEITGPNSFREVRPNE